MQGTTLIAILPFTLMILAILAYGRGRWQNAVKSDDANNSPLPNNVTAYFRVSGGLLYLVLMFFYLFLSVGLGFTAFQELPQRISAILAGKSIYFQDIFCFLILLQGVLFIPLAALSMFQLIRNLVFNSKNGPYGCPPIELNAETLTFDSKIIPWKSVANIEPWIVTSKSSCTVYAILRFEGVTSLDPLSVRFARFSTKFRLQVLAAKRNLKLGQGTFLVVPFDLLTVDQLQLLIYLKRYWCEATGRIYEPL